MVKEIIENLPVDAKLYVDGTAGHGGHIVAIAASGKLATDAIIYAIDRDAIMLEKCRQQTADLSKDISLEYIQDTYANIAKHLWEKKADFILLDIGVNMEHFTDRERGFSVHDDGPLDMRFDTRSGKTAAEILNTSDGKEFIDMFMTYGDFSEKSSEYFTKHILEKRATSPFLTTGDFRDFLYSIWVRKNQLPIIFQCLRIITNQELQQLTTFLQEMPSLITVGGRCAIITFHSIEDRIVKYAFKELAEQGIISLVNKKVIAPHYTEVQKNRAARSAKLRIIEKI